MGKLKSASDRSSKGRNDRCVQGTNDNSVLSKCSMAGAGYFDDLFLQHFVGKNVRRAPLIHRAYFVRAEAVKKAFDLFLEGEGEEEGDDDSRVEKFDHKHRKRMEDNSKRKHIEIASGDRKGVCLIAESGPGTILVTSTSSSAPCTTLCSTSSCSTSITPSPTTTSSYTFPTPSTTPCSPSPTPCSPSPTLADPKRRQLISLGAGFDASFFRLNSRGQILSEDIFIEIDFLPLCQRKKALIRQSRELREMLGLCEVEEANEDDGGSGIINDQGVVEGDFVQGGTNGRGKNASTCDDLKSPKNAKTSSKSDRAPEIVIDTPNYKLLGVDLSNIPLLDACLNSIKVDFSAPTMLLSEVVLPYMGARVSNNLIKWAADSFSNSFFVSYEQLNPEDAFGNVMMKHFKSFGSPLKYISRYPSLSLISSRYTSLHFPSHRLFDMNSFFRSLTFDSRRRIRALESFDEEEEYQQNCAHYVLVAAAKGEEMERRLRRLYFEEEEEKGKTMAGRQLEDGSGESNALSREPEVAPSSASSILFTSSSKPLLPSQTLPELSWSRVGTSSAPTFQRFGHSLTQIPFRSVFRDGRICGHADNHHDDVSGSPTSFAFVIAGFGSFDGRHTRKASVDVIYDASRYEATSSSSPSIGHGSTSSSFPTGPFSSPSPSSIGLGSTSVSGLHFIGDRLFHSSTWIGGNRMILFGGRASPTKPFADPVEIKWSVDWKGGEESASATVPASSSASDATDQLSDINLSSSTSSAKVTHADAYSSLPTKLEGTASQRPSFVIEASPFITSGKESPTPRWRHTATYLPFSEREIQQLPQQQQQRSGQLLVYGGKTAHDVITDEAFLLDLDAMKWAKVNPSTTTSLSSSQPSSSFHLPHRCSHTANALIDSSSSSSSSFVIIFGGLDSDFNASNSAFCFDVESKSTTALIPNIGSLTPRFGHAATIITRRRGRGGEQVVEADKETTEGENVVIDVQKNSTAASTSCANYSTNCTDSSTSSSTNFSRRHSFLVLVGGVNSSPFSIPGVAFLNLTTLEATEFKVPSRIGEDVIMLRNHQIFLLGEEEEEEEVKKKVEEGKDKAKVGEGEEQRKEFQLQQQSQNSPSKKIVIVGGGGNCFSFGTHFNVDYFSFQLPF